MGEFALKTKKPNTNKTTIVVESKWSSKQPSPPPKSALWSMLALCALMTLLLISSGCSSAPVQTFSSADLIEVSADKGVFVQGEDDERVTVNYTVAAITSNGQTVQVVGFSSDLAITAAAVIPFDRVLESMPRTVSEALTTCATRDSGLRLNVNSRTGDFLWTARANGQIHSLYVELNKPGMVMSSTVGLIAHFTFENGRLVRVDNRQIIAWARGQGSRPADSVAPPPVVPTPQPVTTERPALRADPLSTPRAETSAPRPDPAPVSTATAVASSPPAPDRGTVTIDRAALDELLRRAAGGQPASTTVPASAPPAGSPAAPTPLAPARETSASTTSLAPPEPTRPLTEAELELGAGGS